jgi:hypothetical protein
MTAIYKYRASDSPGEKVHNIYNARVIKILSAGLDPQGLACVWVEVEEGDELYDTLRVVTVWTGHTPPEDVSYVGTFADRELILHVYAYTMNLMEMMRDNVVHEDRTLERMIVDEVCGVGSSPEEIAKRIVKRLKDMGVINDA